MHFQLHFPEGDPRIKALAKELRNGYLGIYAPGGPEVVTPVPPATSGQILRYGSFGPLVTKLQAGLNRVFPSYPTMPLVVDGDFGPRTDLAVKEFQSRVGIEADGVVGPITKGWLARFGIKL
jgi:peptidoglycan hydrolase-like protein with peptidoglycan-binding domain